MKRVILLSSALVGLGLPAMANEVAVLGWGGAYTVSQVEAYHKPFAEKTGVKVISVDTDNPATPIKAQVESGNVTTDVASVEYADAVRLCDEGLLEVIDPAILEPGIDGTPATEDFLDGALAECFVATDVFSTVLAYDASKFPEGAGPATIADLFDTQKFPGKRGMRKSAKVNLEMALMADGVPAAEVYDLLRTPEGVDRAFAKLDTIKGDIIWWEAGAQPPQLLADGEVALTVAYNGRIFNAAVTEGKPFEIVWDGQVYEMEGWVIPKGAPNMQNALDFVAFSTGSAPLAKAAEFISYGPPRKSSAPLVGNFQGTDMPMAPNLPTSPENLGNALASDYEFWVDHDTQLNERFNAWIAG